MRILGKIGAALLMAELLVSAQGIGSGVYGRLVWPLWVDLSRLSMPQITPDQAGWLLRTVMHLLSGLMPSLAAYLLFRLPMARALLTHWPRPAQVAYCWCGAAAMFSVAACTVSGRGIAGWLIALVVTLWLCPACLWWQQLAEAERSRRRPPAWIGDADVANGRYRLWSGFRVAVLAALGFAFEGGWREERPSDVFGHKSSTNAEDAGLL